MPTARPSISATVGTVESMSTKPVTAVIPMTPPATPISAVNSGSPAATSEPNVIASTSAATAKPRISPIPPTSGSEAAASPPNSTCTPDACAVSAAAWTASTDPSGMSSAAFAHVTWASATRPSSDSRGSSTASTPGAFAAPATASATAVARSPAISGSPSGAANTIRPDAPLAPGSRSSSRSTASCDSVPGIVAESVVDPLSVDAAANMPTSTTSQATRTALRRRKAMRPSLWRAVAIGRSFGWGAGGSFTIEVAARRDDRRRSPSATPIWTHQVPPLGGRAEGYDGLVPRRADVLWTALATALALALQWADASGAAQVDREPDLLGALLTIAACAPVAVRRAHPLAAAVAALAFACAALALGYMVIVPVLVGLALCSRAAIHSAQRVTVPLGAYAGTLMAAAVTITRDDRPVPVRILLGGMIRVSAAPSGAAVRSERERTRETQEFAQRIAELRDRDVERAVVEERLRIARDVHDVTGHHLSAISLQAAGASRATSDPVARAALERIHRLTSEALGQTRRALGVLRESKPATLAPTPRLEHVEQLLEPARDAGLAVDLRLDGAARPLSDEIEVCAYRVVQESLTNVVRHASATAVHVRVAYGERELTIAVEDDGVGGPGRPGGGIEGMREGVAIVGAASPRDRARAAGRCGRACRCTPSLIP